MASAAAPVKGFLQVQGPAGHPPNSLFFARKPRDARFHRPPQCRCWGGGGGSGGAIPPVAPVPTALERLKAYAQEMKRMLPSCELLCGDADFDDPRAPTSYVDVLNTARRRSSLSEELQLCEVREERKKALQQRGTKFVDGIIQYVSSEKEYYKFIIIACKENTNMIMELGFISSYDRDEILNGLERIEDDIAKGRFEWTENKDVPSNIVEALVERVGEPARKLNATISQYVQKLTILQLWFHDSIHKIVTQIEQFQVELVLLALRNWGFVLPHLFWRRSHWILLGEMILSKVELLERDVSRLRSCKNKIESMLLITLPLGSSDGLDRLSDDGSHLLQNAVINFGNMIVGDVAIDIATLEREISYWTNYEFLTPNDKVAESVSLLKKHISDLDELTDIRINSFACYRKTQDPCQRFLAVYVIVQQILKAATDFAKNASFNNEKVQSSPSIGYINTSGSSDTRVVKVTDKDQSKNKKDEDEGGMATREFRSRSDEAMKRLIDWLGKHQTGETC